MIDRLVENAIDSFYQEIWSKRKTREDAFRDLTHRLHGLLKGCEAMGYNEQCKYIKGHYLHIVEGMNSYEFINIINSSISYQEFIKYIKRKRKTNCANDIIFDDYVIVDSVEFKTESRGSITSMDDCELGYFKHYSHLLP